MKTPLTYDREQRAIYDADDHCVVDMAALESEGPVEHERAAFIVAACNAHERLMGVAEGVQTCLRYPRGSEAQVRCLEENGQDADYILAQLKT